MACCDEPVAIAGLIGGLETSVTESTTSIYLEGAVFNPATVRDRQGIDLEQNQVVGLKRESF